MTLSDDMGVRAAMRQFIENEREFRRILIDANGQFLDWKEGKGASIGTLTIIEKMKKHARTRIWAEAGKYVHGYQG
jgi:hypothetical protein